MPKPQKATRARFCAERGMDELLLISATEASPPGLVLLFISSLMRENISQMPFSSFVLLATLAILPALFWFWFYFVYLARSGKEIQKTALGLFAVGIIVSAAAYVIERGGFELLPRLGRAGMSLGILLREGSFAGVFDVVLLALFSFFFIAIVEEGVKYIGIRLFVFPALSFDRLVDMIRGGVAIGLGFASAENLLYFFGALEAGGIGELTEVFFLRFSVSTLAHTLYSAVMAYYFGIAKFHVLYRNQFLRNAFLVPVIVHGAFNFFILLGMNIVSLAVLAAIFVVLIGWFSTRVHFQAFLPAQEAKKALLPFLADRKEVEAFISHEQITYDVIRQLGFCPFCLAKKDFADQEVCKNCNARLRPPKAVTPELISKKIEVSSADVGE